MSVWLDTVVDVLISTDEETALELIRASSPRLGPVELLTDRLSPVEALAYAKVLYELGQDGSAEEVVGAVLRSAAPTERAAVAA